jgi:hypothetical protein
MKRLAFLGVALALTASGAAAQTPVQPKVGDMAPDFTLKASDGKTYKEQISTGSSMFAGLIHS